MRPGKGFIHDTFDLVSRGLPHLHLSLPPLGDVEDIQIAIIKLKKDFWGVEIEPKQCQGPKKIVCERSQAVGEVDVLGY